MPDIPETRYVWNGDAALAYQIVGEGPDLLYLPPFIGSVDFNWLWPANARFLRRLASFSRLIMTDRRGWGVSDRFGPAQMPSMDVLVEDLLVVLDAANCTGPTLFASEESGFPAIEAAATHPDLFSRLVLFQGSPTWSWKDDMPWEQPEEIALATIRSLERSVSWNDWMRVFARDQLPSIADDETALRWVTQATRALGAPGGVIADLRWMTGLDLRHRLPQIAIPTLLLHREDFQTWPVESSRYMAERIPDARLVTLPGADVYPWIGDWESVTDEIQDFLVGHRSRPEPRRSLATVLFTDVVGSTALAVELGDAGWHERLARHNDILRAEIRRFRGTEIATTGDGFFATFDYPADAVRCALAMIEAARTLDMEIRAGVHTGEVEHDGDDLRGIAVHIGARVMSAADTNELLVSSTVKELAAGSGLVFEDAGEHGLKGVPDPWRLYRVTS